MSFLNHISDGITHFATGQCDNNMQLSFPAHWKGAQVHEDVVWKFFWSNIMCQNLKDILTSLKINADAT